MRLPGPVAADDLNEVVTAMVARLSERLDRDWHVPAGWTAWVSLSDRH
jgi:hypothetical protein